VDRVPEASRLEEHQTAALFQAEHQVEVLSLVGLQAVGLDLVEHLEEDHSVEVLSPEEILAAGLAVEHIQAVDRELGGNLAAGPVAAHVAALPVEVRACVSSTSTSGLQSTVVAWTTWTHGGGAALMPAGPVPPAVRGGQGSCSGLITPSRGLWVSDGRSAAASCSRPTDAQRSSRYIFRLHGVSLRSLAAGLKLIAWHVA
jgi:hypothetical protein